MKLEGKIVNFLGDSITEGAGATDYSRVYHQILKNKYILKTARNYGLGGSRIARQKQPSAIPSYDYDFLQRADEMESADIIVVFGGTNDWGHGDSIFYDEDSASEYTFCGACNMLFKKLKQKYPFAVILALSPLRRIGDGSPLGEGNRQNGHPLRDYVEEMKRNAEKHNVFFINLFEKLDYFDPNNVAIGNKYLIDGIHPSDLGHAIIADVVGEFLLNI